LVQTIKNPPVNPILKDIANKCEITKTTGDRADPTVSAPSPIIEEKPHV